MKVVVVGATGNIGTSLEKHFREADAVVQLAWILIDHESAHANRTPVLQVLRTRLSELENGAEVACAWGARRMSLGSFMPGQQYRVA